jgi:hypothetical protein
MSNFSPERIAAIRARQLKRNEPIKWTCQKCGKVTEQPQFREMPSTGRWNCECGGNTFNTLTVSGNYSEPTAGEDIFDLLELATAQAATIAQLQRHISRIETETKNWIDDLTAEGGARKTKPLRYILAVIQSAR